MSSHQNRYTFSKEANPALMDFMRAVKKRHDAPAAPGAEIWARYLPQNTALVAGLEKDIAAQDAMKIVDLTQSSEEFETSAETKGVAKPLLEAEPEANPTTTYELIELIQDALRSGNVLTEDLIRQLNSDCRQGDALLLLLTLADNVSDEHVCNFGNSVIHAECFEKNEAVAFYFRNILMKKMKEEHGEQLQKMLNVYLHKYGSILRTHLLDFVQQDFSKALQENLNGLDAQHKENVLRDFVFTCTRLEEKHFEVLLWLLVTTTGCVENEVLKKLAELMLAVAGVFSANKTFGKLINALVKTAGERIAEVEPQVRHILASHKSVWKSQAQKAFNASCQNYEFSQSVKY